MVLFVDHDRDVFVIGNRDPTSACPFRELTTDQLSLDEKLSVQLVQRADIDVAELRRNRQVLKALARSRGNLCFGGFLNPCCKRKLGEVSGKPNSS